jgi:hypothetical protein
MQPGPDGNYREYRRIRYVSTISAIRYVSGLALWRIGKQHFMDLNQLSRLAYMYGHYEFGLRYLYDGFMTNEDIERAWKQRVHGKQLTLAQNKVPSIFSSCKIWIG